MPLGLVQLFCVTTWRCPGCIEMLRHKLSCRRCSLLFNLVWSCFAIRFDRIAFFFHRIDAVRTFAQIWSTIAIRCQRKTEVCHWVTWGIIATDYTYTSKEFFNTARPFQTFASAHHALDIIASVTPTRSLCTFRNV